MWQGWVAAFSLVTQDGSASGGQMGEISIFMSIDSYSKILAVLVMGNLHWDAFWCEPGVTFSPVLHSLTCLQETNLLTVSGSAAGWEKDPGRKMNCLPFGICICYCLILIVPSKSRLQATLCVRGSMTVQKPLFSIWIIFSFIHSSAFFSLRFTFLFAYKKNYLFYFYSRLSFTCWNEKDRKW